MHGKVFKIRHADDECIFIRTNRQNKITSMAATIWFQLYSSSTAAFPWRLVAALLRDYLSSKSAERETIGR